MRARIIPLYVVVAGLPLFALMRANSDWRERLFPLMVVLLGLIFTAGGVVWVRQERQLRAHGVRVAGIVERVAWHASGDGTAILRDHPVVRFTTLAGQDLTVESDVGKNPCPLKDGQQVMVVYDPAHPRRARPEPMMATGTRLGVRCLAGGVAAAIVGTVMAVATPG